MTNPRIRRWRARLLPLRLRVGLTQARVAINGLKLFVDVRDSGGGLIMYMNEEYETAETKWFIRVLRPGMMVVDIGAHIGYFTTLAARLVSPTGTVIAIEPDPYNITLLSKNIRQNNLTNVRIFPQALGEKMGTAQLFHSPVNHGDHRLYFDHGLSSPTSVSLTTLNHLLGTSKADVIKIDVQGYEPYVLAGADKILADSPRVKIMTELWPYGLHRAGSDAATLFHTFLRYGFSAALLHDDGTTRPVDWDLLMQAVPNLDHQHPDVFVNIIFQHR